MTPKIEKTITAIRPLDREAMRQAKARQDSLTKPKESLGILEELSIRVAGIAGNPRPKIEKKVIFTLVGDHGVVEERVSAYPQEVTSQMVYNFLKGGAGINVLARCLGARVVIVDLGVAIDLIPSPELINKKVAYGTRNLTKGPALTKEEALCSIEAGMELVEAELPKGISIIGTGDMGIGNTTPSSAIVAAITGEEVERVTGRGAGIDDEGWQRKIKAIKRALELNQPDPQDPIDVLTKVGGLEIGGLMGVILAGAANRIPVVIDGFISGAAALLATELVPQAKDYLFASHCSVEVGHRVVLDRMGLSPLLNLKLRLGEGTGAALGIFLIEAGLRILNEMATFEEARVSRKIQS